MSSQLTPQDVCGAWIGMEITWSQRQMQRQAKTKAEVTSAIAVAPRYWYEAFASQAASSRKYHISLKTFKGGTSMDPGFVCQSLFGGLVGISHALVTYPYEAEDKIMGNVASLYEFLIKRAWDKKW
jgi:hypothetical protein